MGIELLPRTISVVYAGERYDELGQKAAAYVAAFVRDEGLVDGTPLAVMLDQTALPYSEEYICTFDWRRVVEAIKSLEVRGAPAIGIAGAIAVVLCSAEISATGCDAGAGYLKQITKCCQVIVSARPTAVNLKWAVDRMLALAYECEKQGVSAKEATNALFAMACQMITEDEAANRRIGEFGASLLPGEAAILTHCNAGSLATAFFGTALGVIYAASKKGGIKRVYADETRPVGQGARLTTWELARAEIPVTLICDNMAAYVLSKGMVDAVIVGADRVAANGDVANKIGTLGVAIIAKRFGVPFYVACPVSTIDLQTPSGDSIEIEQRSPSEILARPINGVDVLNPAFDVTPADLITAIITDAGVYSPESIAKALGR